MRRFRGICNTEVSVGEFDHRYPGISVAKLHDSFRVAREIKDLKLLRNPDKCFNGRDYPAGISIHQYVIHDNWKRPSITGELLDETESQGKVTSSLERSLTDTLFLFMACWSDSLLAYRLVARSAALPAVPLLRMSR